MSLYLMLKLYSIYYWWEVLILGVIVDFEVLIFFWGDELEKWGVNIIGFWLKFDRDFYSLIILFVWLLFSGFFCLWRLIRYVVKLYIVLYLFILCGLMYFC